MTTWAYRLRVECHADDVATLRQIAVDVCESVLPNEDAEAQRQTFVEQPGGSFACSLAATDELRLALIGGLQGAIETEAIAHPVTLTRCDAATGEEITTYQMPED